MEQPRVFPREVSSRENIHDNIMPTTRATFIEQPGASSGHLVPRTTRNGSIVPTCIASTEQLESSPRHYRSRTIITGGIIPTTRTASKKQLEATPCHGDPRSTFGGSIIPTTHTAPAEHPRISSGQLVSRTTLTASTKQPTASSCYFVSHTGLGGSNIPAPGSVNYKITSLEKSSQHGIENLSNKENIPHHPKPETQYKPEINIHRDGRFMSALRAIHSDKGEPKCRTKSEVTTSTKSPSTQKNSPVAARRRPHRKLQRSQAFMIDRSPSPTGRICEVDTERDPRDDELCALFQNSCGGFENDE
ncbi:uncharacterized protein BKA78DRAFT_297726 [Phyllosticta capitalensis]|uniref:uncharacterized protein n=1 Tax=Phyllosticta capitalensis TaxID=121624 RepID=UPI00312FC10E